MKDLDLNQFQPEDDEAATLYAKRNETRAKHGACSKCKPDGRRKHCIESTLPGFKKADVNVKAKKHWLKSSSIKTETEGLIIAAQDQILPTKAYHHHIIKMAQFHNAAYATNMRKLLTMLSRSSHSQQKQNTYTGTTMWQPMWTGRFEKNTTYAQQTSGINTSQKWREKQSNMTILYDMPIHTDRDISADHPDIKKKKTIGIRNALSLMWLYHLIKIPPPRFLKKYPSIKILKQK